MLLLAVFIDGMIQKCDVVGTKNELGVNAKEGTTFVMKIVMDKEMKASFTNRVASEDVIA
jgi:hypothetical protein